MIRTTIEYERRCVMPRIPFEADKKLPSKKELIRQSREVHEKTVRYLKLSKQARSIPPSQNFKCKRGRR